MSRTQPDPVLPVVPERRANPLRRLRRAVFRTRHVLAPFWAVLAVAQLAALLRAAFPGWVSVLVVLVLLALVDIAAGSWAGGLAEYRLAVAGALVCAAWLLWAIFAGVSAQACAALAIIALVFGVPWWRNHRVRTRRPANRLVRRWPHAAAASGLRGVTITGTEVTAPGQWTHRLDLNGHTYRKLAGALEDLEAKLGLRPACLRAARVDTDSSLALLHVVEKDPLAPEPQATADEGIPYPGPVTTTVRNSIHLGPYEDDSPIELRLQDEHILIVAATGGGKGVTADTIIAQVAEMDDAEPWMIDFKQGRTATKWGPVLRRVATNATGNDGLQDARLLLRYAVAEVARRASAGAELGLDKHQPTPDDRHIVLVVDEAQRVLDDPECLDLVLDLSDTARSEAISLVLLVKRATTDVLRSGLLQTNFGTRIILGRLNNPRDINYVMPGVEDLPLESLDRPGKIFIRQGAVKARPGRVYRTTREQVAVIRARYERGETVVGDGPDGHPQWSAAVEAPMPIGRVAPPSRPDTAVNAAVPAETRAADERVTPLAAEPNPTGPIKFPKEWTPKEILFFLLASAGPLGLSRTELMAATGWAPSTLYDHLRPLRESGEVVGTPDKRWRLATSADDDGNANARNSE